MDIKKYEALVLSVELGSFSKAADKLHITQSGLTHMMNSLEKEIGFSVLSRNFNGVQLTPKGEKFYEHIKLLIGASEKLNNKIAYIKESSRKTITIGSYTSISIAWVLPIIQEFNKEYPDINVEIRGGTIEQNYAWVKEGLVDFAFASNQYDSETEWIRLNDDPLVAVIPRAQDDGSECFDIKLFEGEKVIMPCFGFDMDIKRELEKYGIHPVFRPTAVDDEVILKMVEAGLGISILSDLVIKNKNYDFVAKHIDPPIARELGIVLKAYDGLRDFEKIFIEYAKKYTEKL
ncbi:MAG: LysR family transcriptional regulator [Clostridia bacterium]|nr:LysR family transcriptional regulator [Clostridia bacterium]